MRKFISEILLFTSILVIAHVILFCMRPKGMMGGDYERFASSKSKSLILGTSMAAIDVDPKVITERLSSKYSMPIYNFSFTIDESPYGSLYSKAVLNKIERNPDANSLFILCVDPCNLGITNADKNCIPNREEDKGIYRLHSVSGFHGVNLEYFFKYIFLSRDFYRKPGDKNILYSPGGRRDTRRVWGKNGEDSLIVVERWETLNKPYYEEILNNYSFSEERQDCLGALIDSLKIYGTVCLVYLPVGHDFQDMLDKILPDFGLRMNIFAQKKGVDYISFRDRCSNFQTTDGIHLYGEEARRLTEELCDSLLAR